MPKLRHANSIQARTNVATMKALQQHAPSGTAGAATGMCHGQCGRHAARQGKHRGGLAFGPLVQSFHCLAIWPICEVPLSLVYLLSGTGLGPIVFLAADHINLIFIASEVTGDCIPTTALTQWLQLRGRWVADSGIGCSMPVPEEAVQRIFRHDATRPQGAGESCKTLCGNTASSKECQAGPRRVNLVTRNSRSTRTGHGRNVQFHHRRGNSSDHRFSTGSL